MKALDRHSSRELRAFEARQLAVGYADVHGVLALVLLSSCVTSAPMRTTPSLSSGVVRWLNSDISTGGGYIRRIIVYVQSTDAVVQLRAFGHSRPMARLTEFTSYADAQAHFSSARLWELFDGDRESLNIAHECIDRHVAQDASGGHRRPRRRARGDPELPRDRRGFGPLCPLARRPRRAAWRPRRRHARAVARLLRGDVRRDEARRHRGAAVHAVRARRREAARRRIARRRCW